MERIIRKMGRYALIDKLGQGSMGVVYKAYDEMLDRYVALKTMAADMNEDNDLRKRFYQEARLAARLHHPHIITVYDLGEVEGQIYIAMELLKGTDLKSVLKKGVTLPLEKKINWIIQLTEAVAFAHQDGIVHRDIKPGNIHIRDNGEVVVMDFGIARASTSDITKAGMIIGTPEYISPEQILAIRVDQRADIFSVGVVCYELLTGTHPFRSPNLPAIIHKVLNEKPPPPMQKEPQIPAQLDAIVQKAMEKDVQNRFQNCEAMLEDLLACREELVRQAKELIAKRDDCNAELLQIIGRLQELYSRKDFLRICEELGYDPSSGSLSDNPVLQDVPYSQATEILKKAQERLSRANEYLDSSAELEALMQAGKALYSEQRYHECIEKMNAILAYYHKHELALDYINQCQLRMQEQQEAEERTRYVAQVEEAILNFFQATDITNCQREAMKLLEIEPDNTIATTYLQRCEEQVARARQEEERKQQIANYIKSAQSLINERRLEECQQLIQSLQEADPQNAEVRSLVAQYQRAVKAEQLQQKKKQEFTKTINRAISLRNQGDLQKSLNLLLEARKLSHDSAEVMREIQITEQEIRSSETYKKRVLSKSPPIWVYPSVIAILVAVVFGFYWILKPPSPFTEDETKEVLTQARALSEKGQYEESFRTLQVYISKDPTNPEAQKLLKEVKEKLAQKRIKEQNERIQGMLREARDLAGSSKFEEAIAQYESLLKIDPLNKEAQQELTQAKLKIAANTSRQQLQQEVKQQLAAARSLYAKGNYGQARVQINGILQLDPGNTQARNLLKQIDQKIQTQNTAEDKRKKVQNLLASARNEFAKKQYDRATSLLNSTLKIDPSNKEAKQLLDRVRTEKAKPRYGSITINCEPFGTAYIDGQMVGETPIPLRRLKAGRHVITIKRPGYMEVSKNINISDGDVQHLQFTLQKGS